MALFWADEDAHASEPVSQGFTDKVLETQATALRTCKRGYDAKCGHPMVRVKAEPHTHTHGRLATEYEKHHYSSPLKTDDSNDLSLSENDDDMLHCHCRWADRP